MPTCGNTEVSNVAKGIEIVKAVRIGGNNYINPRAAAKRWVEEAGRRLLQRKDTRDAAGRWSVPEYDRWLRANHYWQYHCWVTAGNNQRHWRRVEKIMERLMR
jgi:hypothetical protein